MVVVVFVVMVAMPCLDCGGCGDGKCGGGRSMVAEEALCAN